MREEQGMVTVMNGGQVSSTMKLPSSNCDERTRDKGSGGGAQNDESSTVASCCKAHFYSACLLMSHAQSIWWSLWHDTTAVVPSF